jgi:hypothetical protein
MSPSLISRMAELRQAIAECPDPEAVGYLGDPYQGAKLPERIPESYQAFLRVANGAVCGSVDLYEASEVLAKQRDAAALSRHGRRWFCIGSAQDNLLLMDVADGAVCVVNAEEDADPGEAFGELDYFLLNHVFGPEYAELVADVQDDPWYELLTRVR